MAIDVNAIEQTIEVTVVGDEVNVNIIDQPVLVSVTDQIIEVEASGGTGPQGPAGAGVASGGTTGQVLIKASNTNFDTTWSNAGAGTVYSVDASGSTGISVTGGPITGAGTLTITNTLPDQVVGLTGAGTTSVAGTYPNFTITSNDQFNGTVTSVGGIAGTGISVTGSPVTTSGSLTITNTAPDQIVGLTGAGTAVITGTYPNFTITANDQFSGTVTSVNLTAGTGISVSGGPVTSSGSINVVNTQPDQVVSLTGGGTTTITGTYPNFTISSADSTVGTVTSVNMTVPTGLSISGNPITSAGTLALALASGYSIPTTASQATWDAAYNDKINSAAVTGTTTKTLTLNQQDGGTITASWTDINTDAVTSVFGRTGAVVATGGDYTTSQVTEVTNLYYTEGRVSANTDVAANTAARHNAVTLGTANGLTLSTQALSLGLSSASTTGALSSTDWTTFNNKQATISLTTTGTSGAATLVGATLNIPQYADQFVGTVTSVAALTIGTTGTDLSSTVANGTTTPVITLQVPTASATNRGALSSADWSTFNGKQVALNGTGFVKISGTTISYDNSTYYLASNPSAFIALTALSAGTGISYSNTTGVITNAAPDQVVSIAASSGISVTGSYPSFTIASTITQYTDTLARLAISETVTGLDYNNTTGVFSLTSGYVIPTTSSATNWDSAYNDKIVSAAVSGTTTKTLTLTQQDAGTITASWTDDNTDAVTSVFGRTGAVVAVSADYNTSQVTESGSLYFTDSRARLALSFVAGSGAYNSSTGAITIPTNNNQIVNGAGYTTNVGTVTSVAATAGTGITISGSPITTSGTLTITNSSPDQVVALTASTGISVSGTYPNFTITNTSPSSGGTVTSVGLSSATSGVTIGATPVTTSGTITLAIATASGSQNGLLSSTDWTTFNNKQNALTNPVTGTGTTNYLPKFTGASTIGNSIISESGNTITINSTSGGIAIGTSGTNDISWNTGGGIKLGRTNVGPEYALSQRFASPLAFIDIGASTQWNGGVTILPNGGGNVAIGSASSIYKLSVTSSANGDGVFYTDGTVSNWLGSLNSVATIGATTNHPLAFYTNGSEKMRLNASGNLSVGNTNDSFKLDVSGTGRFTGQTTFGNTLQVTGNANVPASGAGIELAGSTSVTGITSFNRTLGTYLASGHNALSYSFAISGVEKFALAASTGAATFSSSVTAVNYDSSIANKATLATATGAINVPYTTSAVNEFQTIGFSYPSSVDNITRWGMALTATNFASGLADLIFFTATTERLRINNSGAATFSSSVTATSFIPNGSSVPTLGMYSSAANTLDFSTNTGNKLSIGSNGDASFTANVYAVGFIGGLETSSNIRFNQTLSNSSSGASGSFLTINVNGTLYKLDLLNT